MSSHERLYDLLPAVYRTSDIEKGRPLEALLGILQEELDRIRTDTESLYDNAFIETCEEWLVPYIGELLGVRGIRPVEAAGFSQRAYVANTLRYRRRKGTAAVLEQLAGDLTRYPARVVEFFRRLVTTASLRALRLDPPDTLDVRETRSLGLLGTAFEDALRGVDVRNIRGGRGRHNIPNVGIFLHRIQSWEVENADACPVAGVSGMFRFDPLGRDLPLFHLYETEEEITHLATLDNVPHAIPRPELDADSRLPSPAVYLQPDRPDFAVRYVQAGTEVAIPSSQVRACHLGEPDEPPEERRPAADPEAVDPESGLPNGPVAVDPETGRLSFAEGIEPDTVLVDAAYGFPAAIGAGPYDRRDALPAAWTWQAGVSRDHVAVGDEMMFTSVADAIGAWNAATTPPGSVGVIALIDNRTHPLPGGGPVTIRRDTTLWIVGAKWPAEDLDDGAGAQRRALAPNEVRPVVEGPLQVHGEVGSGEPGRLCIDGVLWSGGLEVLPGDLGALRIGHATFVPDAGGLEVQGNAGGPNARLEIGLERSILGEIASARAMGSLHVEDSLIQGDVDVPDTDVVLHASTLLGALDCRILSAEDSIFTEPLRVQQEQEGCLRFSYVPPGSRAPRRFRCQPDLALEDAGDAAARAVVLARVRPHFSSTVLGHPAYGLLHPRLAAEIVAGAEDGSEMGAYHHMKHALRMANLRAALPQYVRFGLETGVILEQ